MKRSIVFAWIAGIALTAASAQADIENPSDKAKKQEAEILKRVVRISGEESACTATWLEPGILVTALHCKEQVTYDLKSEQLRVLVNNDVHRTPITTQVYRMKAPIPPRSIFDSVLENLGLALMGNQDPADLLILAVDPGPLAPLGLPSTRLGLVTPLTGNVQEGVDLLIAGYGMDRPLGFIIQTHVEPKNPALLLQSRGETSPLAAAYVKTHSVSQSAYEMQIVAKREVIVETRCEPGQKIVLGAAKQCNYSMEFLSTKKNSDPMILSGDSGGPAFTKDTSGNWVLLGVASAGGFIPEINSRVDIQVQLNGGKKRRFGALFPKKTKIEGNQFLSVLEDISGSLMFYELGLDPNQAVTLPLSIRHQINGRIEGYHVSLQNPEIQAFLNREISEMRSLVSGSAR